MKFVLVALAVILALVALLATIAVVWFAYGVAHTGKDTMTDLIVLSVTSIPAYAVLFLTWRLASHLEQRLGTNTGGGARTADV